VNILDIIIAIPLLWGAYRGFKRGFIFEIFMLIGLILGLYIAFKFSSLLNSWVSKIVSADSAVIPYMSFIIVFAAILLILILFAKLLENILKAVSLNALNQVAGAVLGIVKFALVMSVILWGFKSLEPHWNFINAATKKQSLLYEPVLKTASFLTPALQDIKEEFKEKVGK
jgi:membrane protein required for colicin V production